MAPSQAVGALQIKEFRFLDLPLDIRLMIYEHLLDNELSNVLIRKREMGVFQFRGARIFDVFYPELLRINKQTNSEYSALAFQRSCLSITYAINHHTFDELEDQEDDDELRFPNTMDVVKVPSSALEKIPALFIEYDLEQKLPIFDPFCGVSETIYEMPNLRRFLFSVDIDSRLVERGYGNIALMVSSFKDLIDNLAHLYYTIDAHKFENEHWFDERIECHLYFPLYSIHLGLSDTSNLSPLFPGESPAPGFEKYGYVKYNVHIPYGEPEEGTFLWHGQNISYDDVEYVPPFLSMMYFGMG